MENTLMNIHVVGMIKNNKMQGAAWIPVEAWKKYSNLKLDANWAHFYSGKTSKSTVPTNASKISVKANLIY